MSEPLFDYLNAVFAADLAKIDEYTPASKNPELKKEVDDMPGMGMTIVREAYDSGVAEGIIKVVDSGDISIKRAAEILNKTLDEVQELLNAYVANKTN